MTTYKIRFTFNRSGAYRTERVASPLKKVMFQIVDDIALFHVASQKDSLRSKVVKSLERELHAEFKHVVAEYSQYIIGADDQPFGRISTRDGNDAVGLGSVLPKWAPYSDSYRERKLRTVHHLRRFIFDGFMAEKMSDPEVWKKQLGPIKVTFNTDGAIHGKRTRGSQVIAGRTRRDFKAIPRDRSSDIRYYTIGKIEVEALGNITPAMLPALATGELQASLSKPTGLIDLFRSVKEEGSPRNRRGQFRTRSTLAHRLGGKGPYRPTLEPFLGFFLTRSIPTALNNRLSKLIDSSSRYLNK